jgi:hypothetical protein
MTGTQLATQFGPEQVDLIKRTTRDEKAGCLIWMGAKNSLGYGVVERGGINLYVHRLVVGAAPGDVVRHACDNPPCINPEHLQIGTQADNIADAVRRGRIARGNQLPQAKLSPEIAEAIRSEYAAGGVSQARLGKKYGVHQVRISQIVRGKSWAKN